MIELLSKRLGPKEDPLCLLHAFPNSLLFLLRRHCCHLQDAAMLII